MEVLRERIPLAAGRTPMGMATTDPTGAYNVSLAAIGAQHVVVEATYAGDGTTYPARAAVAR
jgi:hypothetical protein